MEYFTQRGLPIPGRGQTGLKGHSCGGAVGKEGAPALGRPWIFLPALGWGSPGWISTGIH